MKILDQYFEALRSHDWKSLAECLAEEVDRMGPYGDVVRGRQAYVDYLSNVLPSLANYTLSVTDIERLPDGRALVALSETLDVAGVSTEFPELLLFGFDTEGCIEKVDIYIKQTPAGWHMPGRAAPDAV